MSIFRVNFTIVADKLKFGVALVQMAVSSKPAENLARATARIEEAARNGAQVVCLPELFQSQYFCQREDTRNFDLAEAVPGPSTEALGRVAKKPKPVKTAPLFEGRPQASTTIQPRLSMPTGKSLVSIARCISR